jgi:hypothetical protein
MISDAPTTSRAQCLRQPPHTRFQVNKHVKREGDSLSEGLSIMKVRALMEVDPADPQSLFLAIHDCLYDLLLVHAKLAILLTGLSMAMGIDRHPRPPA